jgi:hypothetical protein
VRTLRLITFKGGMSFGALTSVSENGLKSFGFVTVTSKLHQEICKREQVVSIQKGGAKDDN